ncbi:hypothetical protein NCLIV_054350 [Neospora caninum Liverpool]|uniref:Uncharacterized protein n=1 Tax=Neospora caninum (strain Liverpool) TaxID=572307 RepID=F0VMR2_NEOCL|nr:hypothetical protein NCLIV_054350 [Neospora caninum Liverpool]CBZ55008.1 hypothetical protein NCLIV_054350 [Neospora caninum Liverpool]|eukprot:XP_003885036.1 hypothetical protein NCLIV_054350 [Neospora caninum Liverpool]
MLWLMNVISALAHIPSILRVTSGVGCRGDSTGLNEKGGDRDSQPMLAATDAAIQAAAKTASAVAAATTAGVAGGSNSNAATPTAHDIAAGTAAGIAVGVEAGKREAAKFGKESSEPPKISASAASEFLEPVPTAQQITVGIQKQMIGENPEDSHGKQTAFASTDDRHGSRAVSPAAPEEPLTRPELSADGSINSRPAVVEASPDGGRGGSPKGDGRYRGTKHNISDFAPSKDGPDHEGGASCDSDQQQQRGRGRKERARVGVDLALSEGTIRTAGVAKADSEPDKVDSGLVAPVARISDTKSITKIAEKTITMITEKIEVRTETGASRQESPVPHLNLRGDKTVDVTSSPSKQQTESADCSVCEGRRTEATVGAYIRTLTEAEWSCALESRVVETFNRGRLS